MAGTKRSFDWHRIVLCHPWSVAVGLVLSGAVIGCGEPPKQDVSNAQAVPVPVELSTGEAQYKSNCLPCHGPKGEGTRQGPPLVHKIYEPTHHGDEAFQRAAANGVRAHHWQFGDMPTISTVTPADVAEIIRYIRWLQRQAGIQ